MAISVAIQRGSWVYIYDENGNITGTVDSGTNTGLLGNGLIGFSSSSVSIKRGEMVYVYDAKGNLSCSISA